MPDRQSRLDDVPVWTWDPRADMWEKGFSRLLDYVKRNGDARVPRSCTIDDYNLGAWVKGQRRAFGKGLIDVDRRHRLKELNGWTWDPNADKWEEGFRRLLDYVERNGDALVPATCTVDGFRLGAWVNVQRTAHSKSTLDADRERRLREEVPGWTWSAREARWEEGFKHLQGYVQRNGDALLSASYTESGYPLGQWVATQRHFRAEVREHRLGELDGWMWNGRRDAIWEKGFRRLLDYVERNGDALVPKRYKDANGNQLGVWVMRQRKSYAAGTLDSDRERRLREEVPGWTWRAR